MSDEKIIEALESFELPVGNRRIYENEIQEYKYFIFRRGGLVKNGCGKYVRKLTVSYVFEGEQTIDEKKIIEKLEELNINFVGSEYDDVQLADGSRWLDMIIFTFERPERG